MAVIVEENGACGLRDCCNEEVDRWQAVLSSSRQRGLCGRGGLRSSFVERQIGESPKIERRLLVVLRSSSRVEKLELDRCTRRYRARVEELKPPRAGTAAPVPRARVGQEESY